MTTIKSLGKASIPSPIKLSTIVGDSMVNYVPDEDRILFDDTIENFRRHLKDGTLPTSFEKAGPRELLFFEPKKVKSAIVTCGGLCPGINDVIRALVMQLYYRYGSVNIQGIRYGYQGFIPSFGHDFVELCPKFVEDIHEKGGSILASSRGEQDTGQVVDTLERFNISQLFCIGGDGTLRGAHEIAGEILARNLKISVIGIPKTIDNDISFIEKTFGFETAFSQAVTAIKSAHVEALGAPNGVGIVKLMGRHSGYIAASAALACREVNYVLVPEVPFDMHGPQGLLASVSDRLARRRHAVIVVAEGAGQNMLKAAEESKFDKSGNVVLKDIGIFLKNSISAHFKKKGDEINIKYIDPSYLIRSTPANPADSIYCGMLAQNAVHAAMAGKTDMVIGTWHDSFTHIPIETVISKRKVIDPESPLWLSVLEATGQPAVLVND
ncbi:MAG: diphosphate--fructose-6-phosphate 1-phosphotransferase [Candidatus Wallbacteria bacterium HGW-Wallbacteria-1]|uniref:ATP-dependent 6-phosphofructokinase n=1 Tax=Candidatus Wallbacteria bacterium HGW-Wallbacteria-1 TaxID=2013854 RepID=A0A2N1PLK6_9BACT|nr:MAG: diphosphate--fructose-6-phosphate 1-phosphotransferase [Candidatus Wallbacteria bacterium HGW-Wallbacteria-1]